jgi:hypothetical protein
MSRKGLPLNIQFFAEESNESEETEVNESEETEVNEEETETKVDTKKIGSDAIAAYLKELGVEDSDALKDIVTKHKEAEDANKTELERSNDTLRETTKQLASEKEARIEAEAKFAATKLGVNPELADDIVTIAKAKVTKDKDISTVLSEMKKDKKYSFYFNSEEENAKQKNKNITRKTVNKEKTKDSNDDNDRYSGTIAERLLSNRQKAKSHFFS